MKKFELTLFDNQENITSEDWDDCDDYQLISEFLKIKFEKRNADDIYYVSSKIYSELCGRFSALYDATLKKEIERLLVIIIKCDKKLPVLEVETECTQKKVKSEPDDIDHDYQVFRESLSIHDNLEHSILYISQKDFDLWVDRGYLVRLITDFKLEKIEVSPKIPKLEFAIKPKED